MSHPMQRLLIALIFALACSHFAPAAADVWPASIDAQTRARYIPVELWAGAEWDGNHELKMTKVDATYRHRYATYYIKGPMEWKHPATDEVVKVYERTNPGRDGVKLQIFTINKIDFIYQDLPYCLDFDWMVTERIRNQTVTHDRQTYTDCPGRSMANQIQH